MTSSHDSVIANFRVCLAVAVSVTSFCTNWLKLTCWFSPFLRLILEDFTNCSVPLRSLVDSGAGIVADGRLLDLLRRLFCFGTTLMKMDIRQESSKHTDALDEITTYLGYGSYKEWDEEKRIKFLVCNLHSPLKENCLCSEFPSWEFYFLAGYHMRTCQRSSRGFPFWH